ncbi:MAG: hypothetical protein GWO24_24575 [Akkermansiaceae bacterium]|nr:hypothetical protein [Akkermansiaceae bacterium]
MKGIHVQQREGEIDWLVESEASSYVEADAALFRVAERAPVNGGYYKTDVSVEWEDGTAWSGRFDVTGHYEDTRVREHLERWAVYALDSDLCGDCSRVLARRVLEKELE